MPIETLLPLVTAPDQALFFRHPDPEDVRLGAVVQTDPAQFDAADVVLLGCPQDEGVRRNGGRVGAAAAPTAIRERLYRLVAIEGLRLFDLGDTRSGPTLEATHATQRAIEVALLRAGKTVVSLGGGNDIAYPDCAAVAEVAGPVLAFNIDAHFDVRPDQPRNSGTPYRMLLDEGLIAGADFWELGHQPQAVAASHRDYLVTQGAHVHGLAEWRVAGLEALVADALAASACPAVFWGFDLDVVRAADAPGVSAPSPLGLSAEEICALAGLAGRERRSRVLELTEVNPSYDVDGRTARLAACVVWAFLTGQL